MARTASIGIRVSPKVRDAAQKAASRDRRTLASYIEKLIVDDLVRQGLLKEDETE